ncbi:MAG: hypothetical protein IPM92_02960 [Saprospiraceae bacterium]|nr:hypothetical protein [Saprospiraceae bacterium]
MNINYFIFMLIIISGCSKEQTPHKLKITAIELNKFINPNEFILWDSLDGPDIYISIYLNKSKIFTSNRTENENILASPINFNLDSNIIFRSNIDDIFLNAYDADTIIDQIMEENLTLTPGFINKSPYSERISCNFCIGEWRITYEIIE